MLCANFFQVLDLASERVGSQFERAEQFLLLSGHGLYVTFAAFASVNGLVRDRVHLSDEGGELLEQGLDLVHVDSSLIRVLRL